MLRARFLCMSILLLSCSMLLAQDEEKLKSGPKAGTFMPGPFECFNLNGPAKGRPGCLVCRFALLPSVLIFAKEPAEGKDEALNELLQKLDETAAEFPDRGFSAGIVFLSPDARDSTNNAGIKDAEEIIEEAKKRKKLYEALTKRGDKYKHVIVACYPLEGPKKYDINPKADLTIVFYERMKILENYVFAPETVGAKDVETITKRVRDALRKK